MRDSEAALVEAMQHLQRADLETAAAVLQQPASQGHPRALEFLAGKLWVAGIRGFNLGVSEPALRGSAFDNLVIEVDAEPGGNANAIHHLDDYEADRQFALPVALAVRFSR